MQEEIKKGLDYDHLLKFCTRKIFGDKKSKEFKFLEANSIDLKRSLLKGEIVYEIQKEEYEVFPVMPFYYMNNRKFSLKMNTQLYIHFLDTHFFKQLFLEWFSKIKRESPIFIENYCVFFRSLKQEKIVKNYYPYYLKLETYFGSEKEGEESQNLSDLFSIVGTYQK